MATATPVRTVKGAANNPSAKTKAAAEAAKSKQKKAKQGQWTITANTGRFTIVPPTYGHNKHSGARELVPGIVLDFNEGRYFTGDKDIVEAVQSVLAGEYGEDLQETAVRDQLNVVAAAKPLPPIPAWDVRNDCVQVAAAAGLLDTPEKLTAALKYEKSKQGFDQRVAVKDALSAMILGDPVPSPATNPTIAL